MRLRSGLGQAVEGGQQTGLPRIVAHGDGLAQGVAFEHDAGLGDVLEVFERHRGNAEAALSLADHQGVGDEQGERFAQGAGTDAVVVLEMLDAELLARGQAAFDDVAPQGTVGRFDQGLRLGDEAFGSSADVHDVWLIGRTTFPKF